MALPRFNYVVVDTNLVRKAAVIDPLLAEFRASGQIIMLPWTAMYEYYRKNTSTFWASVEHFTKEPDAVAFAQPTMEIFRNVELRYRRVASDVTAPAQTKNIRKLLRNFRDGTIDYDHADRALATATTNATKHIRPWEGVLRNVTRLYKGAATSQTAAIQTAFLAGNRGPLLHALNTFLSTSKIAEILAAMPIRGKLIGKVTARRLAERPTFATLMMLAIGIRSYEWALRQGVENAKGLVNDGIDIESILVALYGKDFISTDVRAMELYASLLVLADMRWPT